ncbi:HERC1, partial [Symbiodinium pilosum]
MTGSASRLWLSESEVVTWGDDSEGADSSKVRQDLHDVVDVKSSHSAFAAIRQDGSVITWGAGNFGGLGILAKDELRDVKEIESSYAAFAAIRGDGTVIAWGDDRYGGDCSSI